MFGSNFPTPKKSTNEYDRLAACNGDEILDGPGFHRGNMSYVFAELKDGEEV